MYGNDRRSPAAALAGGIVALLALLGCASEPRVANKVADKSAAAFREGAAHSHGHDARTPGGAQAEPDAAPGAAHSEGTTAGHDHSEAGAPPTVAETEAASPGQPAATLRPDALDAPAATSVSDAQRSAAMAEEMTGASHSGHGGHGGAYRQVDAGRGPGAHEGSHDHTPGAEPHRHGTAPAPAPAAQEEEHSHEHPAGGEPAGDAGQEAALYVCPMHPEVTSKTPGKCPKCGMALVERRKE